MPAPFGNKNRQKGLYKKDSRIQFRATQELKDALDARAKADGEAVTDVLERLVIAYVKRGITQPPPKAK